MSWEDHPEYGGAKPSWWEAVFVLVIILLLVSLFALLSAAVQ